jgi:Putative peptidoglycan binding domain
MKKIVSILLIFISVTVAFADVYVKGYTKSNGTYVAPHYRSNPDGNPYNNWSYPGNTNPYTGVTAGGNSSTYLENYYNNLTTSYYNTSGYTSTPSCPLFASYDSISSSCKCMSGYVVGKDFLGKESCLSQLTSCQNQYGYGATYSYLNSKCECSSGYVVQNNKCVSATTYCSNTLGIMSTYNSFEKKCECMSNYKFDGSNCVYNPKTTSTYTPSDIPEQSCPANASLGSDKENCYCNKGYKINDKKDGCMIDLSAYTTTTSNVSCPSNSSIKDGYCQCNSGYNYSGSECVASKKFITNLTVGSSGDEVLQLQKILNKLGLLMVDPNGYFGKQTKNALKDFQKVYTIPQTGLTDEKTREFLNKQ